MTLLAGGIGSGKSFAGSHYAIHKCVKDGRGLGLIAANTYKQLTNSTLACLFAELDRLTIPFTYKQQLGKLWIKDSEILCLSLENYDYIRGVNLGWFWADEVRDTREAAILVLMGRLRDKRTKYIQGRFTSSTAGFNWMHDYFRGDKKTKDFHLIQAASHDNPFLPDDYIQTLSDAYDKKLYQQEVLGKFINVSQGLIYYSFDRKKHLTELKLNKEMPIMIGMDFNINPMTGVICQVDGDNNIKVIDEIYLMTSNTNEVGEYIKEKYSDYEITIIPDATGRALKTSSSGKSDHAILREYGFNVVNRKVNPFRVDRYNAVNAALDKGYILIDNNCRHLIRDLEQVSYKSGGTLPDTTNKDLVHISDALGYLVYYVRPLTRGKPSSVINL